MFKKRFLKLFGIVFLVFSFSGCSNSDYNSSFSESSIESSSRASSHDNSGYENSSSSNGSTDVTYGDIVKGLGDEIDKIPLSEDLINGDSKEKRAVNVEQESQRVKDDGLYTFFEPTDVYNLFDQITSSGGGYSFLWNYYDFCINVAVGYKDNAFRVCDYLNKWTLANPNSPQDQAKVRLNYDEVNNILHLEQISYMEARNLERNEMWSDSIYVTATFSYNAKGKAVIDFEWICPKFPDYGASITYYMGLHYVEDEFAYTEDYRYSPRKNENDELGYYDLLHTTAYVDLTSDDTNITVVSHNFVEDVVTGGISSSDVPSIVRIQRVDDYYVYLCVQGLRWEYGIYTLEEKLVYTYTVYDDSIDFVSFNLYEAFTGWDKFEGVFVGDVEAGNFYDEKLYVDGDVIYDASVINDGKPYSFQIVAKSVILNLPNYMGFLVAEMPLIRCHYDEVDRIAEDLGLNSTLNNSFDEMQDMIIESFSHYTVFDLSFESLVNMTNDMYDRMFYHVIENKDIKIQEALDIPDNPISFNAVFSSEFELEYSSLFEMIENGSFNASLTNVALGGLKEILIGEQTILEGQLSFVNDYGNKMVLDKKEGILDGKVLSFPDFDKNFSVEEISEVGSGTYQLVFELLRDGKVIYREKLMFDNLLEESYNFVNYYEFEDGTILEEKKDVTIRVNHSAILDIDIIYDLVETIPEGVIN